MQPALQSYISPDARIDPRDAETLAAALNRLGYYDPDPRTGIVPFDPDHRLFTSLRKFQTDHGLFGSGAMRPGDPTDKALQDAIDAQNQSGTSYIWRSVRDIKSRSIHAARDGQVFRWDNPPPGGHPGEDYNCRCWAEPMQLSSGKYVMGDERGLAGFYISIFKSRNWKQSERFLRHYIGNTGTPIKLTPKEIAEQPIFENAMKANKKRFEDSFILGKADTTSSVFKTQILSLKDGGSVDLKNENTPDGRDYWDQDITKKESEKYGDNDAANAFGKVKLRSYGRFTAKRVGNVIHLIGVVDHTVNDRYDFNKSDLFLFPFRYMEESNKAKSFSISGSKSEKLDAKIYIENNAIKVAEFKWKEIASDF